MFKQPIQDVMDRVDALRHTVNDHWQIPREEALLLAQLVRMGGYQSLCEIGVSYGYSTLHLAAAAKENQGHLHAVDISEKKITAARKHLTDAGLIDSVSLHQGDARQVIATLTPHTPFDFAFIDAEKCESHAYLEALLPKLAPRCAIVTDNTNTHADELAKFVNDLRALPGARSCHVDVGNGFELTLLGHGERS